MDLEALALEVFDNLSAAIPALSSVSQFSVLIYCVGRASLWMREVNAQESELFEAASAAALKTAAMGTSYVDDNQALAARSRALIIANSDADLICVSAWACLSYFFEFVPSRDHRYTLHALNNYVTALEDTLLDFEPSKLEIELQNLTSLVSYPDWSGTDAWRWSQSVEFGKRLRT